MAQTKTKNAKRPKASKAKPTASKARKASSKAKKAKSPASQTTPRQNGSRASSNGHSGKATIPLIAGGAALAAGTIGGVLIGASHAGGKVLGVSLPQPRRLQFKVDSGDLAKAARQVGRFGENVGDLTAELKRARAGLSGDNKHSSPVEVLLRGLTARR